ncbi:MAG: hypothetical protein AB1426_05620 [Bacillota bacterium]
MLPSFKRFLENESGQLAKGPMDAWEVGLLLLAIAGVGAMIGLGFLAVKIPG